MKKHICKLGLVASLVMGVTTFTHAAQNATVNFTGEITKATCNVTSSIQGGGDVQLGSWAKTEFPDSAGQLVASAKSISLSFSDCTGDNIASGGQMDLKATSTDQSSALTTENLWGDSASAPTKVGIKLMATNKITPAGQALTPTNNVIPLMAAAGASGQTVTGLNLDPVTINASLASTVANSEIQPGTVKSSVVFSAVYN